MIWFILVSLRLGNYQNRSKERVSSCHYKLFLKIEKMNTGWDQGTLNLSILYTQNQGTEELQVGGHPSDMENQFYIPHKSVGEKNKLEIQNSELVFLDIPTPWRSNSGFLVSLILSIFWWWHGWSFSSGLCLHSFMWHLYGNPNPIVLSR